MRTVFPYATLAGEVQIEVTGASLDSRPQPLHMISRQEHAVALHENERPDWREARLELRATLPERELASGPWTDVQCFAVLTEGATNARTVGRLFRDTPGEDWRGSVILARELHRRRADLQLVVSATVDGVGGRVIGSGERSWIVDLTARTPVRPRDLNIGEVDFRDPEHAWLNPFKDAPWLVETTGGDLPTVYLNLAFEGLKELLDTGGAPAERALRGTVAAQIAAEAWTAMFHSAIGEMEVDDDGTPQWPGGWRDSVLRVMLPDVYPDLLPADALFEVHSSRADGSGWHELQSRIQYAASRRARVAKTLGTAIRTLDRPEGARA
ncbi:hypothetical protein [Streptomyces xinghaiensis]|uniref:hypothetical protein n=1 Tax=Streptomyces xinghaiensis TaxID=1038928 RepID=UPI002E100B4F|nr:hypothetical protein OG463_10110 [Streptomyces xinghaiensis]